MNEIIDDERVINNEIFLSYFNYQNPSLLVKDLIRAKQNKNQKSVNNINNGLIDLRNDINRKEIPENENPKKVANIVGKALDFNKQQKGKGRSLNLATQLKILTPKQILRRLPTALARVKEGNHLKTITQSYRWNKSEEKM